MHPRADVEVYLAITIGLGMSAGSRAAQKQSLGDLGPNGLGRTWSLVLVVLIAILGRWQWQQYEKAVAPAICKICAR